MSRPLPASRGGLAASRGEWWAPVLLGAIVLTAALIRLRVLDVPLDRDEGEYAYIASLLLDGVPPYAGAYNMKMPGIYGAYAIILTVFGKSPAGIHLGVLVANGLSTVLVFFLARRLGGAVAAVSAAATFAAASMSPALLGIAGYAEHFVVLGVLAGTLRLLTALETPRWLPFVESGALFGLAFTLKQSGGVFLAFALAYVLVLPRPAIVGGRRPVGIAAWLTAGALLPPIAIVALLVLAGSFDDFTFWTLTYAWRYVSAIPLGHGVSNLAERLTEITPPLALVALSATIGLGLVLVERSLRSARTFLVLFLLASCGAVSVGLYFRYQYFLLATPAIALLSGLAPAWAWRRIAPRALALAAVIVLVVAPPVHAMYAERAQLFQKSPLEISRMVYAQNPFTESMEIGRYVRQHTAPGARIAVIGSEPQIYFYADRRAATGYIYTYPLMERHPYALTMQGEMIAEIEAGRPEMLVFVNMSASWLRHAGSSPAIFQWFEQYRRAFDQVGVIEIAAPAPSRYFWDRDAAGRVPGGAEWITVFRRKSAVSTEPERRTGG